MGIIVILTLLVAGFIGNITVSAADEDWEKAWGAWWVFSGALCVIPILLFIVWLFICVWVYRDAEKRGKNGALWLIICLLFGIIGLIIWVIVRPPETSFYEKKRDTRRSCPDCGREIPFDANICPYCGKKFEKKKGIETAESNQISLNGDIKLKDK